MRIKNTFILRNIADVKVLIPVENSIADFNGIITINETASLMIEMLQHETSIEELTAKLLQMFDVSADVAREDVECFIRVLEHHDMLEECQIMKAEDAS